MQDLKLQCIKMTVQLMHFFVMYLWCLCTWSHTFNLVCYDSLALM